MIGRTLRALVTPKFSLKRLGSYRLAYSTIKNADPNADYIMFKDDLWYDHKHKANYSEVVRVIRNDASRTYNERAVAYILYNMGVAGTEDLIMMDFLERWLDKYRGKFTGRFIFGAFDGALRVNMKSQYTRMFLEDYQKHKPVLSKLVR
jgi:hypothetical protein